MKNNTRYSRQIILPEVGENGQQKLQNARVLVIGAGGLGCPVLQNLAQAGVGHIGIVDGDVIEESNLHRQSLYTIYDNGAPKVAVAKKALQLLNPEVTITVFSEFFVSNNAAKIVNDYHVIVDCTDAIAVRYLINDIAVAKRIPVVYASIHKFQGQVAVFNYQNGPSYRCLFPENENGITIPSCEMSGVIGILPNTLGAFQATEVLKIILGFGTVLSGKLLLYTAFDLQTQTMLFQKNPKQIEIGMQKGLQLLNTSSSEQNHTMDLETFLHKKKDRNTLIIDLREPTEKPEYKGENIISVPLHRLKTVYEQWSPNQEIVLFCQSGQRSLVAMHYMEKSGFTNVFHLEKGIASLKIPLE